MATIKMFRKSFTQTVGGGRTDHRIEETHNWPLTTCLSFKQSFPDNVISIDAAETDHDHKTHHRKPSSSFTAPFSHKKVRRDIEIPISKPPVDFSGAAAINAELARHV